MDRMYHIKFDGIKSGLYSNPNAGGEPAWRTQVSS